MKIAALRPKGFTLIEVIVALLVVSFSLIAVAGALSSSALQSSRSMVQLQAGQLANAYLADALSLPVADPGGLIGKEGNRNAYDNIADFNGDNYVVITDRTNAVVAGYVGYSATFVVVQRPIGPNLVNALQVTVRVQAPDGSTTEATGFRTQ
jgi:prepilin-type N-terminal cleavage/methylation domain-containing protein